MEHSGTPALKRTTASRRRERSEANQEFPPRIACIYIKNNTIDTRNMRRQTHRLVCFVVPPRNDVPRLITFPLLTIAVNFPSRLIRASP